MTQETGINDYRTMPWAQIKTRQTQRKSKQRRDKIVQHTLEDKGGKEACRTGSLS